MKKRNYAIIITVLIMVLIGIFLLIFLSNNKEDVITPNKDNNQQTNILEPEEKAYEMEKVPESMDIPAVAEEVVSYNFNSEEEEERLLTAEDLKKMAFAIAERFGSYSNQGKFGNIIDLKVYMNEEMKDWADDYVAEEREKEYSGEYYGITTTALSGEVLTFNNDTADILINTRRKEVSGTEETVFDQDIKISFEKTSSDWKISGAYWQK